MLCDECVYYALAQEKSERETALMGAVTNHLISKIQASVKSAKQEMSLQIFLQQNRSSAACYSQLKPKQDHVLPSVYQLQRPGRVWERKTLEQKGIEGAVL